MVQSQKSMCRRTCGTRCSHDTLEKYSDQDRYFRDVLDEGNFMRQPISRLLIRILLFPDTSTDASRRKKDRLSYLLTNHAWKLYCSRVPQYQHTSITYSYTVDFMETFSRTQSNPHLTLQLSRDSILSAAATLGVAIALFACRISPSTFNFQRTISTRQCTSPSS